MMLAFADCEATPWSVVIRLTLGVILLLAGGSKWFRADSLERFTVATGVVSTQRSNALLRIIPIVEVLLGVWLFTGWLIVLALGVAFFLFVAFTVVLCRAIRMGYKGTCACFGSLDRSPVGRAQIVRNIVLTGASASAWLRAMQDPCTHRAAWDLAPSVLLIVLVLIAVSAAIYLLSVEVGHLLGASR